MSTPEPEVEAVEVDETVESDAPDTAFDDVEIEGLDTPAPVAAVFSDRPIQTVGRRKEAVVRVRLMPGSGQFRLNGKTLEQYFPNKLHQQLIREPLVTVEKTERFDIFANLTGGGTSGQAGALLTETPQPLTDPSGAIVYPGFDADVLYWFRLYSVIAQAILWGVIGIAFAPLAERLVGRSSVPGAGVAAER